MVFPIVKHSIIYSYLIVSANLANEALKKKKKLFNPCYDLLTYYRLSSYRLPKVFWKHIRRITIHLFINVSLIWMNQ